MKCKIRDKDGIYLSPWLGQYTRDPEKAGCWSEKSAQNILHSSLPDVSRREWQLIPADETTAAPTEDEADRVLALDWHNFARQQSETLHRLLHAKEELQKRLSRLECELNDILHAVELMELSETKEWELFSRLKENRCARRACKDTLLLLDTMGNATGCELADGRLTRLTDTLSNRTYTPRVCKTLFSTEQKPRETELLEFYDFGTTFKED